MFWQILWILLAILFILYGVRILRLYSGTGFFLVWFAMGALCLLLAAAAHFHLWRVLPHPLKVFLLAAIVLSLVLFAAVEIMIIRGFHRRPEKGLDCIIVLGAQIRKSGPSLALRYRLDEAFEYLKDNEKTICITSGGQGSNEPCPEAQMMKEYLVQKGIPESRILTEDSSTNTKENIILSMKLIDPANDRVGIVTNNFHIFRSERIAKKAGIAHLNAIPADSNPVYLPNNMLREFLGVLKDFLSGNM